MSYTLYKFGTTLFLPCANASQDIGTGTAKLNIVDSQWGGAYDLTDRRDRAMRGGFPIAVSGVLFATSAADLVTEYNKLRGFLGKKEKLYRKDDTGNLQWIWARLEAVNSNRTIFNTLNLEVSMNFVGLSPTWNSSVIGAWRLDDGSELDDSLYLDIVYRVLISTNPQTVPVVNEGNAIVRGLMFTITSGNDAPITSVVIEKTGETQMTWTGTLATGNELRIDFGALSVKNNGVDEYANIVFGVNHIAEDWLHLDPGTNNIIISITGGGGDETKGPFLDINYYSGWI